MLLFITVMSAGFCGRLKVVHLTDSPILRPAAAADCLWIVVCVYTVHKCVYIRIKCEGTLKRVKIKILMQGS